MGRVSPLEKAISDSPDDIQEEQLDLLLPLLLFEEHFPAFGEIVALVICRLGVNEMAQGAAFNEPAEYLAKAAFSDSWESSIRGALCHIVRGFLDDPDIEYSCRPELARLVDQFIDEVHRDESAGG